MAARWTLSGGDRLTKLLKQGPPSAIKDVADVIRQDAMSLRDAVKVAAPKGATGLLERRIQARFSQKGLIARVGIFGISRKKATYIAKGLRAKYGFKGSRAGRIASLLLKDPYYARFVERGTVKMKARPFLFNTYGARRTKISSNIVKSATTALRRQAGA